MRVVFGTLVAVGKPPEELDEIVVWITDHAYHLRGVSRPSDESRGEAAAAAPGSAPQLAGTTGPTRSSTTAACSRPSVATKPDASPLVADEPEIVDAIEARASSRTACSAACTRGVYDVRPR